jgi:uncharacterized protein YjlB
LASLKEQRMPVVEELKRIVGKLTGIGRPARGKLDRLVRLRKPELFRFRDDGETPNNPRLPLVVYRGAVRLDRGYDPAAIFEETFARHGWRDSWRDGVYDFLHFHTATHEVLGIARGRVTVQFGGAKGCNITLAAGDVVVLPAGTGHRRIRASRDLLVVGAYPAGGSYDEPRPEEADHARALASIAKVKLPLKDPVYGAEGALGRLWTKPARVRQRQVARARRAKARSAKARTAAAPR